MKTNIDLIIQKHHSGGKLSEGEIRSLMLHGIDLLKELHTMTLESISRAHEHIALRHKKAA